MPRAFYICYLKSLCIFPNELKLQPKIPQISRKCLEAKFRGCFRQVQQVNVKEKNYGQFPEVFIKFYKKFWAISTIKWRRKKICRKTKQKKNLIGSFSALGEISHMQTYCERKQIHATVPLKRPWHDLKFLQKCVMRWIFNISPTYGARGFFPPRKKNIAIGFILDT